MHDTKIDNDNVFILGLGNQKCGTTWLYKYLNRNCNFDGGFAKEYHIWDALDVPLLGGNRLTMDHLLKGGVGALRYNMQNCDGFYFDYFHSLYKGRTKLSADITPSYSGLECSRLKFIKNQFAKRNVLVKVIILIRDPISRIKSAVRFNLDRHNYDIGISFGETDFARALVEYSKTEHCRVRTSYNKIISNAYEVFDQANVYVGIYENMFEFENIKRLSKFCGVSVCRDFASEYVNKTKNKVENNPNLEKEIRKLYADVYKYCYERFPITKTLWK